MTVCLKIDHGEDALTEMSVEKSITGNMLKQKAVNFYKKRADQQTLWFMRPGSDKLQLVDDTKTLEACGIEDNSVIKEGRDLGKASPDSSELRRNINSKENFSYYYAHKNETPLPDSTRYVYGGDPIPLGKTDTSNPNQPPVFGEESSVPKAEIFRPANQYSWADSGDWVKIYITQKEVLEVAAKWDAAGTDEQKAIIQCDYTASSVEIRFKDAASGRAGFKFLVSNLSKKIDPEGCKAVRVSGSKITITLKKEDPECKWYDLKE